MCQTLSPNSLPMAPHIPRIKATSPYTGPPRLYSYLFPLHKLYLHSPPAHSLQPYLFLYSSSYKPYTIGLRYFSLEVFSAWRVISPVFCMAISLTSLKSLHKCHVLNSLTGGSLVKTAMLLLLHSPQFLLTLACYLQLMQCAALPTGVNISPQSMGNACHIGLNKYLLNVE